MFTRKRAAKWLGVFGVIALILGLQPYFRTQSGMKADGKLAEFIRANPGMVPMAEEFRFGWADSPLFGYRSERTLDPLPDGGYKSSQKSDMHIGWWSWSSITLVIGIGLIWAGKRLRPVEVPEPAEIAQHP